MFYGDAHGVQEPWGLLYCTEVEDEKDAFSGSWLDLQVGNMLSCLTLSKYASLGVKQRYWFRPRVVQLDILHLVLASC